MSSNPPGHRLDFSRWAIVLAAAGVVLSGYLTWVHLDADALVCGLGDCHTVQASDFATVGPLPVALLGLAMYATVLGCIMVAQTRAALRLPATIAAFAVSLAGAVYAAYLTWIEVAVIEAICQWCVISALLTLLLTIVLGNGLWRLLDAPRVHDVAEDTETGAGRAAS